MLHELGERFGFPLHVVNVDRLRDNARRFLRDASGTARGCEVFYSYKTHPVPGVLRLLHAQGLGAEVISHYELWLARRLGVPPERIVFNGPSKSEEAIRDAVAAGIGLLNINHREEVAVVARIAAALGRRARVGIRIAVGGGWHGQFGTSIDDGDALAAFTTALREPSLDVVGLHAHRGGMIRSVAALTQFVTQVLAFADRLRVELGFEPEILDLGGSLGTPTVAPLSYREMRLNRAFGRDVTEPVPAAALSIDAYCAAVMAQVDAHYRAGARRRPRIFLEPGRAVTGDAQLLLASVLSIKQQGSRRFAILDAGINLAEACRSEHHFLFAANRAAEARSAQHTLVGPICTPGDTLYWSVRLPALQPNDSLAIMDSGAYFVPFATSFSFPQPAIVAVEHGEARLLRRAETFEDLTSLDVQDPDRPA